MGRMPHPDLFTVIKNPPVRFALLRITLLLLAVTLGACSAVSAPAAPAATLPPADAATPTPTQPPLPTGIPTATPTAVRTPPALPSGFTTGALNPLDTPHTYITDTCQYLRAKWDSSNAAPGTVVMVIMFHSITDGQVNYFDQVGVEEFNFLMRDLHEQGFEAITTAQLAAFMTQNARIPPRSVVLLVDDRKTRAYFDTHFKPYRDQWGWPVVNAWISNDDYVRQLALADNIALEQEGWVDHQSHGTVHNIPMTDDASDDYIKGEFEGSLSDLQTNFGKTPTAIIWPGGRFGVRPVQFARQYGYQLGFTVNPRGPLMFNWVPLANASDPARPSYIAEGAIGDPLMTLPRYWSTDARAHIGTVRQIGNAAAEYAQAVRATELEYYDIVCAPTYGVLP